MASSRAVPAICFVTRDPVAINFINGAVMTMQDSTSMILFVGYFRS